MLGYILLAVGLVLILEGLVYALAPSLIEDLLDALRSLSLEARRLMGLIVLLAGICCLALANALGAL